MEMNALLIQLVLAVLAAIGGGLLALFVKGKQELGKAADVVMPESWHWVLEKAAEIAVRAAEQYFDPGANGDKLNWAIEYVFDYMDKAGYELSDADRNLIQGAIEKAVYELKREWGKLPETF